MVLKKETSRGPLRVQSRGIKIDLNMAGVRPNPTPFWFFIGYMSHGVYVILRILDICFIFEDQCLIIVERSGFERNLSFDFLLKMMLFLGFQVHHQKKHKNSIFFACRLL